MKKGCTHQATTPGKPAYEPATMRKVPKYFAPIGTSQMLITKPTRQKVRPASTNGYRVLMRSDQTAQMGKVIAGEGARVRLTNYCTKDTERDVLANT